MSNLLEDKNRINDSIMRTMSEINQGALYVAQRFNTVSPAMTYQEQKQVYRMALKILHSQKILFKHIIGEDQPDGN